MAKPILIFLEPAGAGGTIGGLVGDTNGGLSGGAGGVGGKDVSLATGGVIVAGGSGSTGGTAVGTEGIVWDRS
ncbi:hypothetical protein COT65_01030, partial [Candidatus Shapirobacteria bacterium CG09_land_8_20_14_0_10_47_13]